MAKIGLKNFDPRTLLPEPGSIRNKLIAAMVGVAVVPLAVTVVISNIVTSDRLEAQTGSSVQEVAARTADLISQTLVENVHLIETLAASGRLVDEIKAANAAFESRPEIGDDPGAYLRDRETAWQGKFAYDSEVIDLISDQGDVNPVGAELHRFRQRFQRHSELVATNKYGALVAATNRTQNYYFGDKEWWASLVADGTKAAFVSRPFEDQDTGRPSVELVVPILDEGDVIGVLSSALEINEIVDVLKQVKLGTTGILRVYDADGVAIFDPTSQGLGTQQLPGDLVRAGILTAAAPGWERSESFERNDAIHGYSKPVREVNISAIPELGWTTVASQDASEALQAVGLVTRIQVGVAIVVALLVIAGSVILARLLTRQITHITSLFDEIHKGNYEARALVESQDELGKMAEELNVMLDDTLKLIQSQEERDAIQASVMRLLEEVADVAEGDLTVRAEVTPDITGAIADSFNYMIAELRRVIGNVQSTSTQVTSAATTIRGRMEELASGSSSQSQQIVDTSNRIQQMAGSIQQVSVSSVECSNVAALSLENAREGTDAVDKTISGMTSIRTQVREASKRLKRLGESSQEIGQIVKLIGEISDRTSILALNASIQAAAAGEAGDSFAVVADEIELLAERSAEASQRIETLIKTVQVETAEAMAAMEDTTREVVSGSELANDAGYALEEIEKVSEQLAELVSSITTAATEQARNSEVLVAAMTDISQITQQTAFGTQQAANQADDLAGHADNLRDSVRRFTVPAKVA